MTCALAIYPGGRTHARACDGDGRIVGVRNRTHVCIAGGAATCTPIPISRTSTHIPTYICKIHAYRYKYMYIRICTYIHIARLSYAQLYLHTETPAHARPHTSAHTPARAFGGPAAHNGPRRIDDPPSASRLRWRAAGPERRHSYIHTDR
jgi:hypothetical protein